MYSEEVRRGICEVGRRMHEKGLAVAYEGNISCRLRPPAGGPAAWEGRGKPPAAPIPRGAARYAITPAGSCKGDLATRQILLLDEQGRVAKGAGAPSSELPLHLGVYRARPDAVAVVHAHPPAATGFAATTGGLRPVLLPEAIQQLGGLPLAPYAAPGSEELFQNIRGLLMRHKSILLANHGVLCFSTTSLMDAYYRLEQVEQVARITMNALQIGSVNPLSDKQIKELKNALGIPSED